MMNLLLPDPVKSLMNTSATKKKIIIMRNSLGILWPKKINCRDNKKIPITPARAIPIGWLRIAIIK